MLEGLQRCFFTRFSSAPLGRPGFNFHGPRGLVLHRRGNWSWPTGVPLVQIQFLHMVLSSSHTNCINNRRFRNSSNATETKHINLFHIYIYIYLTFLSLSLSHAYIYICITYIYIYVYWYVCWLCLIVQVILHSLNLY